MAGYLRWTDYRSKEWPSAIKIEHHKTGAVVWHPLEEQTDGGVVKFYEEAEAILAQLPRRGLPMILREVRGGVTKPFSFSGMQKIVHTMRDKIGLPFTFTLDACRHGGMTELEEAELTDGRVAASAHRVSGLRRVREAHNGPRPLRNPQAPRSPACERGGNEHSE